jgi:hypothetical protein
MAAAIGGAARWACVPREQLDACVLASGHMSQPLRPWFDPLPLP